MRYPAVKGPHRPIRRPDGRIWVGSAQYGLGSEIADETGVVRRILELMDGTRTPNDIVATVCREWEIDADNARDLIDTMIEAGWIEDVDSDLPSLTAWERERYSRGREYFAWVDMNPRRHPYELQEELAESRVTVIGLGGTGSAAAMGLVATGVGHVRCADFDRVELSNLNRQFLYTEDDLGRPKVDAAVEHLKRLNSDVTVEGIESEIGEAEDIVELTVGQDLLVMCADKPTEIRNWTNEASIRTRVPWVSAAYNGPMLNLGTYIPGRTRCFECLLEEEQRRVERVGIADVIAQRVEPEFAAVIAPTAQIPGSYAVLESLNLLLGLPIQTAGRQFHQNFIDYQHNYYIGDEGDGVCPHYRDPA